MSGTTPPPDSPSYSPSSYPLYPKPSNKEKDADKIAKLNLPASNEQAQGAPLTAERISQISPVSKSSHPSLMEETPLHIALKIYDNVPVPSNTTLVLSCYVFDGVGDLEHLIHMIHHLLPMRKQESLKIAVFVFRSRAVPETAWQMKLAQLSSLGLDDLYVTANAQERVQQIQDFKLKTTPSNTLFQITISMDVPVRNIPHIGFVSEYMENPVPPHIHLIQLNLGFFSHTFGLWIKDDPVFDDHPTLLREPLQQLLFGSPLTPKEQTQWEVGCASLRDDQARLVWIALRLHQVKEGHHCALVLSPFSDPSTAGQQLEKLAADYKFDSCIIRAKDGTETTIGSKKDTTGRTLRLIHSFIDEQDFHSLIHLSAQGSLGGAGDTACIRGLLGHQPLFVDIRPDTRARWEETIRFLKKKEFPLLAQWFGSCFTPSIVDLLSQLTPELTREWEEFRLRAREELETSPWVTRYIRRCALAARTPHQKIESLETAFLKGEITLQKYNESIQQLSS